MEQQNINRLAHEKSPYLLQHKNNPVDWFPWGQEAFNKAKNEDKPIFLSVGYSTCHWCHVMEHESFENPEIASLMNKVTVPIKVDREERPDVDKIYMSFLQATSGGGGWPMSVWLTPDLKPFFAGTYFPPTSQYGRPGFPDMLRRIDSLWKQSNHRDELIVSADKALQVLRQNFSEKKVTVTDLLEEGSPLLDKVMDTYFQFQVQSYDGVLGGFGKAPKFPRPVIFTGLFHFYSKYKVLKPKESVKALEMCQFTLKQMYKGGIHDHIGGGYHRYSVDKTWHVPHFEKMLYDQSQLASSYLDTYQITKNQIYATAARDILGYVLEKLRSPVKGFYSAEDADSLLKHGGKEHAEGAFYVWEKEEIDTLLGESSPLFCYHYGVLKEGNAPQGTDPHGEFTGKNILIQRHDIGDTASKFGIYTDQTLEILEKSRNILKKFRENRPKPFLDDKIITAWNGLMISAFAKAAMVLGDEAYAEAAEGAALFIQRELFKDGHLIRNYREGPSMVKGFADDYAFLITALLDLYENVGNIEWLKWAINLQETMDSLFYDHNSGGYYSIETGDSSLVLRMKEEYDGSEPSPNSYAVHNLVRLYNITQKEKYKEKAKQTLSLYEKELKNSPAIFPHMVAGLDMYFEKLVQITINGHPKDPSTREWLKILGAHYIPHKVVIYNNEAERQSLVELGVENLSNSDSKVDTKVVAQVCKNQTCQIANSPQEFDTLLSK